MQCPGQDRAYWTGEVAFEVSCPKCDSSVEFFKDESSARCPNCGHRFRNPRVSFDCAKWCAFAAECIGFVPEREMPAEPSEGMIASRLIRAVKDAHEPDQARIARALTTFQYARELLSAEGGDPRIILASALLLETDAENAKRILDEAGVDADTAQCIRHILRSLREGTELETIEFKVVSDSRTLSALSSEGRGEADQQTGHAEHRVLRTEAGKQKARRNDAPSESPTK